MAITTIRIAMLNTYMPVPTVYEAKGSFGDIFHSLLSKAAARLSPTLKIESINYDVRKGEYPSSLLDVDLILLTGSGSSAYDDDEWIHQLDAYVSDIHVNYPSIKIFGSCFGHQLVCQSLFRGHGVTVEKDPKGWELGVQTIQLTDDFRSTFMKTSKTSGLLQNSPMEDIPRNMRLQFVHSDHVKISAKEALPPSFVLFGNTEHCATQGIYQPGRVLTFQGHFEFDRFVNTETMKVFGATWKPEILEGVMKSIDADDDALLAAEMV
ncbi:class I glutamine amidotransferase-like protein, partial [Amniculicola lignicola CBS 123094]